MSQNIREGDKVKIRNGATIWTVIAMTYGDNIWVIEQLHHNLVNPPSRPESRMTTPWFTPRVEPLADCKLVKKGAPVMTTGGN